MNREGIGMKMGKKRMNVLTLKLLKYSQVSLGINSFKLLLDTE